MEPTTPAMDWSTVDFMGVFDSMIDVVPYAIPVILAFIGFRKGYAFLKGQVKGA